MSAAVGIGLKPAHYPALLRDRPPLDFLEVHTENYMGAGGPPHRYLAELAEWYPLSFHGVGLSLGGADTLNRRHLTRWRELADRYEPALVSEHVAWSSHGGYTFHDLLPIPYTEESLRTLCMHVEQMQEALGRHILIENPSRYLEFNDSTMAASAVSAARAEGHTDARQRPVEQRHRRDEHFHRISHSLYVSRDDRLWHYREQPPQITGSGTAFRPFTS